MADSQDFQDLMMDAPIFYIEPDSVTDDRVILPDTEGHHAISVMRLARGYLVVVIDGLGNAWRGEIAATSGRKKVEIALHSQVRNFGEPNVRLTLACGLSTGYKFDSIVQKGTELGVSRFVPLITEKSKVKIDDPRRARTKLTRYEKVALAAVKQCRRSFRPEITRPVAFERYVGEIDSETPTLIFHPSRDSVALDNVPLDSPSRVNLIVGPESGFSPSEVETARDRGAISVSLGTRILRAENAGPVICALVMDRLGELR
ncbi:MAG: 16S rRNA (uracil(1498)-N(3))-methyltransferase [candidate division Zixibacteria bacterium]|nr:16S rRNA (uracil(1498)-N(3))-methyltransferase [candidate division Zixibacteria bacterium]